MKAVAVIVAGGKGERMGQAGMRKQYLPLNGSMILMHTLSPFVQCDAVEAIYLVVPPTDLAFCKESIRLSETESKPLHLVPGGSERQDSVFAGLKAAEGKADLVIIHDAVRPFVRPDWITETVDQAGRHGACILAVPATDTLKQCGPEQTIHRTMDRKGVWLAQTPQTFHFPLILRAHENARQHNISATDDAELLEHLGYPVRVIPGSRLNIKITTPDDLALAKGVLGAFHASSRHFSDCHR
jgi:2-C-methyl-D-erythritol 4-phosphate cytidylyltransferase